MKNRRTNEPARSVLKSMPNTREASRRQKISRDAVFMIVDAARPFSPGERASIDAGLADLFATPSKIVAEYRGRGTSRSSAPRRRATNSSVAAAFARAGWSE